MLIEEKLSENVIRAAIEVHRALGPGLLESVYEECLAHELDLAKIPFRRQVPLPITYKAVHLDCGYRLDFDVEEKLIVELKAVEKVLPIHKAQLLTYMRLSGRKVGLLLNFNSSTLKDGITRLVL
jgi:GxxExxY protein